MYIKIYIEILGSTESNMSEIVEIDNDNISNEEILKRYIKYWKCNDYINHIRDITGHSFFDMVDWKEYIYFIEREVSGIIPKI